jgi:hypothetical protein
MLNSAETGLLNIAIVAIVLLLVQEALRTQIVYVSIEVNEARPRGLPTADRQISGAAGAEGDPALRSFLKSR